jgi:hypothetical protein
MPVSGWESVPALLRHCTVAVYHKSTGGGPDGVIRALKICRDQLAKQGYMYHRGRAQVLENIGLTGKGFVRSLEHAHEGSSGSAKDLMFKKLFELIEPQLWELDGPGGVAPPRDPPGSGVNSQEQERAQMVNVQQATNVIDNDPSKSLYPAFKAPKK